MFDILINNYNGYIHISTGMLNKNEREKLYTKLIPYNDRIVIYLCTSAYPLPFEQLYLNEIITLSKQFSNVGFSNHARGVAMGPVCYALGARYFEYHFIDDRLYRHNDSANSLEPQGLHKLIRDLKAVEKALKYKPNELDDIEKKQRNKLRI